MAFLSTSHAAHTLNLSGPGAGLHFLPSPQLLIPPQPFGYVVSLHPQRLSLLPLSPSSLSLPQLSLLSRPGLFCWLSSVCALPPVYSKYPLPRMGTGLSPFSFRQLHLREILRTIKSRDRRGTRERYGEVRSGMEELVFVC